MYTFEKLLLLSETRACSGKIKYFILLILLNIMRIEKFVPILKIIGRARWINAQISKVFRLANTYIDVLRI
jgi:hypothetical protein